jgi:hypothetical protein
MTRTTLATYDGRVLRPDEPLALAPNTRVKVTVETVGEDRESPPASFLAVAQGLNLEGPPDWSARLEEYLYGA